MSDVYDYVKVDIAMEVDYPASPGTEAPDAPKEAYVSYVIDTPGAKPGEEGLYDGYEVTSVPANSREVVEWQGAYRTFQERVQVAHLTLQVAEKAWRDAIAAWKGELTEAAQEYAPVHEEIEARKAMVEAQDAHLDELERQGKKVIEAAALEAEDAVLGPRRWVLFHRTNHLGHRVGLHTLHTVECRHVHNKPKGAVSEPMRAPEAVEALGRRNVSACGSCKPSPASYRIPQQRQA
jgi:hypothetical protein